MVGFLHIPEEIFTSLLATCDLSKSFVDGSHAQRTFSTVGPEATRPNRYSVYTFNKTQRLECQKFKRYLEKVARFRFGFAGDIIMAYIALRPIQICFD